MGGRRCQTGVIVVGGHPFFGYHERHRRILVRRDVDAADHHCAGINFTSGQAIEFGAQGIEDASVFGIVAQVVIAENGALEPGERQCAAPCAGLGDTELVRPPGIEKVFPAGGCVGRINERGVVPEGVDRIEGAVVAAPSNTTSSRRLFAVGGEYGWKTPRLLSPPTNPASEMRTTSALNFPAPNSATIRS